MAMLTMSSTDVTDFEQGVVSGGNGKCEAHLDSLAFYQLEGF
ncbi:hypothetical protein PAN31108_00012 [Pandoraea anhela]|uniref:Uncharacterized protein n=1 Tax=Pandoraea anhela TaxID=2508295 RepID=A0A5E4RAR3_9BURK|nr:hypothetical protein PAN31108_00012 [Pandoraea anhela]